MVGFLTVKTCPPKEWGPEDGPGHHGASEWALAVWFARPPQTQTYLPFSERVIHVPPHLLGSSLSIIVNF